MAINLKGRSFLTLEDFTPAEIRYLLDLGHDLKAKRRAGICDPTLQGKHIVLLFEKTSTRTRCSFEVAATQEGGHVTYLDAGSSQMGKKESLEDTAKVLGRFFDGIEYRGYDQKVVEDLAKYAGVPVWNGLTDADHPTQILADMMTIEEHCHKPLNQVKVVFPGDVRNNMCYAWMIGAAKMGMHFVGLGPQELAKEMDALESENAKHRAAEQQRAEAAKMEAIQQEWDAAAERIRAEDPGFDIKTALADPDFAQMLKLGVKMEDAYKARYFDDIMARRTTQTAKTVEKGVEARIRQRGARPAENGTNPGGAAVLKTDVSKLTPAQCEELERRAMRGQIITF